MKKLLILVLILFVSIVIFQNTEVVETKILFFSIQLPRAILLFLTLSFGFVLGLLVSFMFKLK